MHLYLSSESPWNTSYTTAEGQVVYKVDSPYKLKGRTATIRRVLPDLTVRDERMKTAVENSSVHGGAEKDSFKKKPKKRTSFDSVDRDFIERGPSPSMNSIPSDDYDFRDRFAYLAQIEFHSFQSSLFKYGGTVINTKTFFTKKGWSWYGRHRIFMGPDGKEYKWKLTYRVPKLYLNDKNETKVATFHRKRSRFFGKGRPASLEIFSEGEHMMDLILITFIYMEKLRREREEAAEASEAAAGA